LTNDTTVLLGLDGLASEKVEADQQGRPVVHLVTTDPHTARRKTLARLGQNGRRRIRRASHYSVGRASRSMRWSGAGDIERPAPVKVPRAGEAAILLQRRFVPLTASCGPVGA
jgi:hypothetical protein